MEFKIDDKVRFLTHNNEISKEVCTIIEICQDGNVVRLKKPNNEIMKIFHDRLRPVDAKSPPKEKQQTKKLDDKNSSDNDKFNPFDGLDNGEVWVKKSKFSSSIIMKSYVIINLGKKKYKSVNVYNDKLSNVNVKEFELENYDKLVIKLTKKEYEKIGKE